MNVAQVVFSDPPYEQHAGIGMKSSGLLGPGTLEFAGNAMRLQGVRAQRAIPWIAGILVGLVCVTLIASLMVGFDLVPEGRGSGKLLLIVGILGGVLPGYGIYALLRRKLRGSPVLEVLSPTQVLVLRRTHEAVVLRLGGSLVAGDVTIVPADGASATLLFSMFRG